MKERLIDANALAQELLSITYLGCDGGYYKGRADERDDILERIANAPTVEPKRGEWEWDNRHVYPKCSACENYKKGTDETNFCPNCGADMRKEVTDEKER